MFRSQEMKKATLTIASEAVHPTLRQIGRLERFHIVNLANPDHPTDQQMKSKHRATECSYWLRKLNSLEERALEHGIEVPSMSLIESPQFEDAVAAVEEFLMPVEQELDHHDAFQQANAREISEATERLYVLRHCQGLNVAEDVNQLAADAEHKEIDVHGLQLQPRRSPERDHRFQNFLCGVIEQSNQALLQRMVYRVSRGNAFVRYFDIDEPIRNVDRGVDVSMTVFYIVTLGEQLLERLTKLCQSLNAHIYAIPDTPQDFRDAIYETELEIDEKRRVYERTDLDIVNILTKLAGTIEDSPLRRWQDTMQTEKSINGALMQCRFYNRMITMEGWCPTSSVDDLQQCLVTAARQSNSPPAHCRIEDAEEGDSPPTYFETNKFTSVFQSIVDTYGVPRYQEINPALFTIVTFPFLFGVMYGDIGHAACLILFALYLIYAESKLQPIYDSGKMNEILVFAYAGRYMILLMGAFGMYCGFVYNDCFSVPLSLFQSQFWFPDPDPTDPKAPVSAVWRGGVFPFGIDPSWYGSANELEFFNSLKMKLSVILGVVQMLLGIGLSLFNHLHYKDYISAALEFVPRFIFMAALFGYMIALIIYKWSVAWDVEAPPPNLVQTMVNMFLSPGSVDDDEVLYSGQAGLQTFLLLIAVVSVPVMLCGLPCVRYHKIKKQRNGQHRPAAQAELLMINNLADAQPAVIVSSSDLGENDAYRPLSGDEERALLADSEAKMPELSPDAVSLPLSNQVAQGDWIDNLSEDGQLPTSSSRGQSSSSADDHSLSEMMIHNGIHTIEFVLGAVSNTASYLRLWALSLAHAQLSLVFWDKLIMQYGLDTGNPVMVFASFAVWAAATFGVLLCMSMLECFLHALRLHWVEFQNKFYHADGHAFDPFTLQEKPEST